MTAEAWRPVVGREGEYEVSSHGRLRSLDRVITRKNGRRYTVRGRLVAGYVNHSGYRYVALGQQDRSLLHRLVLAAFVGPAPEDKPEGCHRDGDQLNNHISNLYWGDRSDNMRDMVMHGHHNSASKTHCKNGHPFDAENTRVISKGRVCIPCRRASQTRYDHRRRGTEAVA